MLECKLSDCCGGRSGHICGLL